MAHEFLEIHLVVAEGRFRFTACNRQDLFELRRRFDDAHAAAAAAPARLQHDG
jgi:hypothetical protein